MSTSMNSYGVIKVSFNQGEAAVLEKMAREDCRTQRDQLRWLLREEARRRGWWTVDIPGSVDSGSGVSP